MKQIVLPILCVLVLIALGFFAFNHFSSKEEAIVSNQAPSIESAPTSQQVKSEDTTREDADLKEHLSFKGIPINGSVKAFTQKLEEQGFTLLGEKGNVTILKGTFWNIEDCSIQVNSKEDQVYLVGVLFPAQDKWRDLEARYNKLKESLTKKYGAPKEVVEKFEDRVLDSDLSKWMSLQSGDCTWKSIFELEQGIIGLSLVVEGYETFVFIAYIDKINVNTAGVKALDDL